MDAVNKINYKKLKYQELSDSLKKDLTQCDSSRHIKDLRIENLKGEIALKDTVNSMLKKDKADLKAENEKINLKLGKVKTTRNVLYGISGAAILVIVLQVVIPH